ncbi:uncharacterized protein N7529_002245 [Penicillium soppii]|uniref:uncharacterized protein n=1 Tax=Penicillium soppii TaxID=69789 RepID=UPI0025492A1C|nr:uncharacterized protein N7529_002245 [Penicillium soppii]KAJ5873815.1 hypothetical protein N7529_002245 [Penicillium soppii]
MFAPKPSAPAGGLSLNTNSTSSLFGNNTSTSTSTATPGATSTTGGLFGNAASTTPKPAGSLFGAPAAGTTQPQTTGSNMFGATQSSAPSGGSLFPNAAATTTQPPASNLFGGATAGAGTSTTQGTTGGGLGGGLFGGASTAQSQAKPAFGSVLGGSNVNGSGMFGAGQNNTQQQQQQPNKPTLSLFGQPAAQGAPQPLQQSTNNNTVIQGVKVDVSNLLPTTKYESCADEIRNQIEAIDKHILNQMKMCHEVGDLLPTIEKQGATIPNDVDFVQGKLETMQHALENDARDIDGLRNLVTRDAAEAEVAFRAIDTLKLPLQYQSTGGGWWSVQDQNIPERSMRSSRKNTLALPDGVEGDASATSVNGVPVNLIDYFSHRSKEMKDVLGKYTGNLKEIEDHLHGVEATLNRQISDFVSSKSRDGNAAPRSTVNELAAVLSDVEAGIMGVATRLSTVSEQVQDMSQQSDGRYH